jgi:hypothetical protein
MPGGAGREADGAQLVGDAAGGADEGGFEAGGEFDHGAP